MERPKYKTKEDERTFTVRNEDAIDRLRKDGKIDLPPKKVNVPKDQRWNEKIFYSATLNALEKGGSSRDIAKAIFPEIMSKETGDKTDKSIIKRNKESAMRNARTMFTEAQNLGRLDSYKALEAQGVVQKKIWSATPDDRTRESHIDVDGEEQELDNQFSNGCMYPGDSNGPAEEVWNCRCAMDTKIIGFKKADGSVSRVNYEYDRTLHHEQMDAEKEARHVRTLNSTAKSMNGATKILNNIGFNVGSTPRKMDDELYIETANRLNELERTFGAVGDNPANIDMICEKLEDGNIIASVSHTTGGVDTLLTFNKKYYSKRNKLKQVSEGEISKGYAMPCDANQTTVYDVTHEYGHILQHRMLFTKKFREEIQNVNTVKEVNSYYKKNYLARVEDQRKEIIAIAKELNPKFSVNKSISVYGKTNSKEFFAEAFANARCGKPNDLGNAMNEYLRRNGYDV